MNFLRYPNLQSCFLQLFFLLVKQCFFIKWTKTGTFCLVLRLSTPFILLHRVWWIFFFWLLGMANVKSNTKFILNCLWLLKTKLFCGYLLGCLFLFHLWFSLRFFVPFALVFYALQVTTSRGEYLTPTLSMVFPQYFVKPQLWVRITMVSL